MGHNPAYSSEAAGVFWSESKREWRRKFVDSRGKKRIKSFSANKWGFQGAKQRAEMCDAPEGCHAVSRGTASEASPHSQGGLDTDFTGSQLSRTTSYSSKFGIDGGMSEHSISPFSCASIAGLESSHARASGKQWKGGNSDKMASIDSQFVTSAPDDSSKKSVDTGHSTGEISRGDEDSMFDTLCYMSTLTRPKQGRPKRVKVGAKPFSGVRGIYFQKGSWKVKFRGTNEAVVQHFPYRNVDEMRNQFARAKRFLHRVIQKGRQLHDSDGEGLSDDNPAWERNPKFQRCRTVNTISMNLAQKPLIDAPLSTPVPMPIPYTGTQHPIANTVARSSQPPVSHVARRSIIRPKFKMRLAHSEMASISNFSDSITQFFQQFFKKPKDLASLSSYGPKHLKTELYLNWDTCDDTMRPQANDNIVENIWNFAPTRNLSQEANEARIYALQKASAYPFDFLDPDYVPESQSRHIFAMNGVEDSIRPKDLQGDMNLNSTNMWSSVNH